MDKDVAAMSALIGNEVQSKRPVRKNVEAVRINKATRKTKITFCILGMWSPLLPPYNIARLTALTRAAGFETSVFDWNIESYYYMKTKDEKYEAFWEPSAYFRWIDDKNYHEQIFPEYKEILDEYITQLEESDSDIIGFSIYDPNKYSTYYVAKELKQRCPEKVILMGGPECMEKRFKKPEYVDHYFIGETEGSLLQFLEDFEKGIRPKGDGPIGVMFGQKRVNLDELPFPDYNDFPMEMYTSGNRIMCTELSRGCVARCTYCTEVYYWKFRDRDGHKVVDEIQYAYDNYGINYVYFADSLMNGNIAEFRVFLEEMARRIKAGTLECMWWGYARADGRMDDEFYKLIADAGGLGFNYGFETGSDKVLKAINKKNTVAEINANIKSAHKYGVKTHACWVIGAPGEEIEDWNHSLNMLWNHRDRINEIAPGNGLGDTPGSAYDDREKFNITPRDFFLFGDWSTLDKKNTKIHRLIRIKQVHMWSIIGNKFSKNTTNNCYSYAELEGGHFKVNFLNKKTNEDVEYEFDFDFNIIKSNLGDFANSLMNEIWAILRMLWRVKGAYDIKISFNPEIDNRDMEACMHWDWNYTSDIDFSIDKDGKWKAKNYYNLEHKHENSYGDDHSFEYTYEGIGKW
tara:strand:+ start:593 stop:2485 length:1893 start_codon:yes stop_codon:yes gene_type:complete